MNQSGHRFLTKRKIPVAVPGVVLIFMNYKCTNMKAGLSFLFLIYFLSGSLVNGQSFSVDKVKFFNDTSVLNATITTNLSKMLGRKKEGEQFGGTFVTTLQGGISTNDPIMLEFRGHFRKDFCYLPPLKINFKNGKDSGFSALGSLKLVSECKTYGEFDQDLLKEFLIYRIYNLLTDMSFRVRLLNLNFIDSSGKKKAITEHAFLMEDLKDLAKRNNCHEWKDRKLFAADADRKEMTIVGIFEYMIGNTDWGVAVNHNTRYIISKTDSLARPFIVPYDFDYSGFVNTSYAIPDEKLGIENVRQRLYRGLPRTMEELNDVLDTFKKQKENIYTLISKFDLLTANSKKEIVSYLDDFYSQINKPEMVKSIFIQNAITNE